MMCPHCSREWLTQAERAEHIRTEHSTPGDGGSQQPAPRDETTDVRYLDPVALTAWLAQTADSIGLDHATIDRLQAQVVHEAERHPARMVEARTLRRVLPRPT